MQDYRPSSVGPVGGSRKVPLERCWAALIWRNTARAQISDVILCERGADGGLSLCVGAAAYWESHVRNVGADQVVPDVWGRDETRPFRWSIDAIPLHHVPR